MKFTLPACVTARRFGHWSQGPESEYDIFGDLAAITWTCNCGSLIKTETLNCETGEYTPVPNNELTAFLADHQACVAKCYNCGVNPVAEQDYWCEECEELS